MPDFFENDVQSKLEKEKIQRETHSLWCEKFRPLTLDTFLGNAHVKSKIAQYIKENDIPHILFFGPAGGGKTTASNMLAKSINCDSLYLNASDENSIDDVRNKIQGFAASVGFRELKVLILDEFDGFTYQAQAALRNLMETYSRHTRFILTCNYVEKIILPIRSRCQEFELRPPSQKEIAIHLANILKNENIQSTPEDLSVIVKSMYPDIRRIINTAQMQTVNGALRVDQRAMIDADYRLKILEILRDKSVKKSEAFKKIRQIIADDSISTFSDFYKLLFDEVDSFAEGHIAASILIIAEGAYKETFVVDREIAFMAMIINLLNELKG